MHLCFLRNLEELGSSNTSRLAAGTAMPGGLILVSGKEYSADRQSRPSKGWHCTKHSDSGGEATRPHAPFRQGCLRTQIGSTCCSGLLCRNTLANGASVRPLDGLPLPGVEHRLGLPG